MGSGGAAPEVALNGLLIEPIELPQPRPEHVRRRLAFAIRSAAIHLGPVLTRRTRHPHPVARGLRRSFEELGGTFVKFGQLIGSSPSLFSDEVAAEFRRCLDAGPPVPFYRVRAAVEEDLGRPFEELFGSFEREPIAAASLAVVHRATLPDGTPVAVKVLRPRIERRIATDLAVMRPLFEWVGREVAIGIAGVLPGLVDGLREQMTEELDLRNEARSQVWFRNALADMDLPLVRIPEPVPERSGRRVLTMELLDGVAIDDLSSITTAGVNPRPAIEQMLKAWFAIALCHGVFHGDVHAGNLLVDHQGRVGVVDWGIVGRLDADTHHFFRRLIEGTLGDETAWVDVNHHFRRVYGNAMPELLGLSEEQMPEFIRMQAEPFFAKPFGEVDLRQLLMGPPQVPGTGTDARRPSRVDLFRRWQAERRFQRGLRESGGLGTSFDRGTFLLGKQLVYLDRYGKLYLPDVPLIWDREVFRTLLART